VFNQYLAYRFIRLIVKLFPLVVSSFDSIDSIDFQKTKKNQAHWQRKRFLGKTTFFDLLLISKNEARGKRKHNTARSLCVHNFSSKEFARRSAHEEEEEEEEEDDFLFRSLALSL
jgi:hypothetical protein